MNVGTKLGPLSVKYFYGDPGDEWDWVANPRCEGPTDVEQLLIARREDVLFYGGIKDEEASYSYDDFALISLDGQFYLLQTTGCSCPSPSETWCVEIGPASLKEIRDFLTSGKYDGYTVPGRQMEEFLTLIDSIND